MLLMRVALGGGWWWWCVVLPVKKHATSSPLSPASLSSVLFRSWNAPTFVYLLKCVCPAIIFPAWLPAECTAVWINETELTGLLMKACSHGLHFWRSLCTREPLGEDFYIWVFVVLLIKAHGNGLVFANQAFLISNASPFPSLSVPPPPPFLLRWHSHSQSLSTGGSSWPSAQPLLEPLPSWQP